jgi:hypothetical protein
MYVWAMNCVGSLYSNQKSVGWVTIMFSALALDDSSKAEAITPIKNSAALLSLWVTLHTEGCVHFVCF